MEQDKLQALLSDVSDSDIIGNIATAANAFDDRGSLCASCSFDLPTPAPPLGPHPHSGSCSPTIAGNWTRQEQPESLGEDLELEDACQAWVNGHDFLEFPLERLLRAKQFYVPDCRSAANPDLALFLAISLEDHLHVTDAAECYVVAFRGPDACNLDDYEGMDDELRIRFKQRLSEVLKLSDDEAVKGVKQVVDLRVKSLQEAIDRFNARPKPPARLTCTVGAAYMRDMCQHAEQVQLALYYADGLCIEHFGRCLLSARRKVSESRRAVLYEEPNGESSDNPACVGHAELSLEHLQLLDAARKVASSLTPEAIEGVMQEELACATHRAGTEVDEWSLLVYFNPRDTVPYATPTFQRVQRMYTQLRRGCEELD